MSELRELVVERLTAARSTGDAAPLRDQEAMADALALLGEAAPSPEGSIDLEAVAAVFWTFWGRHQGAEDPEAAQNMGVGVAAFGFLCPRLPEEAGLPESLKENFDPADPSHQAVREKASRSAECTAPDCVEDRCGAALDAVVSSYAPGLQTLAYARARARQRDTADHGSALLVAASEDDLPGMAAAATHAAELLGAQTPLVGPAATREAVLAALHDASWAHFGCHAATNPAEPSGALLHLPSGEPVSVLEICQVRPRSARVAFLAACGTARTAERLADERPFTSRVRSCWRASRRRSARCGRSTARTRTT
ncbi:CHAT domain-containing protein [Streptomyces sp. NPDC088252]|uniref:CHAT domain-containing protein n=1 Tax=Streptomyces sp. NPDC088252 TaxID=3365845 RepID=UPI00380C9B0A